MNSAGLGWPLPVWQDQHPAGGSGMAIQKLKHMCCSRLFVSLRALEVPHHWPTRTSVGTARLTHPPKAELCPTLRTETRFQESKQDHETSGALGSTLAHSLSPHSHGESRSQNCTHSQGEETTPLNFLMGEPARPHCKRAWIAESG